MALTQKYGIKFPFTCESTYNCLVDLNTTESRSVESQIMHLLFTPVGQRIRKPLFGTKLIQYLFSPNDTQNWNDILYEIKESVSRNIPNCSINNLTVEPDEMNGVRVKISYNVNENGNTTTYNLETTL